MLSVSISHPVMEPRHERGGGPKRCSFIEFSDSGASRRNLAFFLANVWSLRINWMGFFPFFSSLLFVNARSEVLEYFGKVMTSGWRFIKSNENFSSEKRQENFQYFRSMIMYVYIYIEQNSFSSLVNLFTRGGNSTSPWFMISSIRFLLDQKSNWMILYNLIYIYYCEEDFTRDENAL